jgi:hypothetical protein
MSFKKMKLKWPRGLPPGWKEDNERKAAKIRDLLKKQKAAETGVPMRTP